jgi:hypothetical protein
VVAKHSGGVDIAASDFGMLGEDFLRAIERAVPHGHVNEFGPGILASGLVFRYNSMIIARAPARPTNAVSEHLSRCVRAIFSGVTPKSLLPGRDMFRNGSLECG